MDVDERGRRDRPHLRRRAGRDASGSSPDGRLVEAPFLDISDRITSGGERGLLGLAFHPDFPTDPRFFVDYTDDHGDTVIASFTVDPATPDLADPASELILLTITQPFANHNGGAVTFGPDGMLYIAMGDGGSGGDPEGNGQRLDTLLGKILRIDVQGPGRDGGGALRRPARQPVRRSTGRCPARDLAHRPAQPVAHPLRRPDGRPVDRRRRPGRLGGGRRHPVRTGRPEPGLEHDGGHALLRGRAVRHRPGSRCRSPQYDHDHGLLDRRRGRRA